MGFFSRFFKRKKKVRKNYKVPLIQPDIISKPHNIVKINYNLVNLLDEIYADYRNKKSKLGDVLKIIKQGNYSGNLDEARKKLEKITDKYARIDSNKQSLRKDLITLESLISIRQIYDRLNKKEKKDYTGFDNFVFKYAYYNNQKIKEYKIKNSYVTEQGRLCLESLKKFGMLKPVRRLEAVAA